MIFCRKLCKIKIYVEFRLWDADLRVTSTMQDVEILIAHKIQRAGYLLDSALGRTVKGGFLVGFISEVFDVSLRTIQWR